MRHRGYPIFFAKRTTNQGENEDKYGSLSTRDLKSFPTRPFPLEKCARHSMVNENAVTPKPFSAALFVADQS